MSRLSRIISVILRDLYSIKPVSVSRRTALAAKHTSALKEWRKEISYFLDVTGISASFMKPIYQRQKNVLNFAYWHAMILTNRPFLLSNFARLQRAGPHSSDAAQRSRTNPNVQECLQAAMNIVETVNGLFQADQMFRGYWVSCNNKLFLDTRLVTNRHQFTLYFAFSAVVILYVYVIQLKASPVETYQTYLEAADTCQKQISAIAEQGSLTRRYCLVLEELRNEALRQTTGIGTMPLPDSFALADAIPTASAVGTTSPSFAQLGLAFNGDINWNASPSSSMADITSWGHFDSLVSCAFRTVNTSDLRQTVAYGVLSRYLRALVDSRPYLMMSRCLLYSPQPPANKSDRG